MKLHVEVRPYRRSFRRPLTTAHGEWRERRGFLLRITDDEGKSGFGEVAPVPWLGSETEEEAAAFLRRFQEGSGGMGEISRLPACRFGIDSAMADLRGDFAEIPVRPLEVAALLPSGSDALEEMASKTREGFRIFKWKIGVLPAGEERELYRELDRNRPEGSRLRLDANGALSLAEAREWLRLLDETGAEMLEQPLPVAGFAEMVELTKEFATPIALDEGIGGARQFEEAHRRGWTGLYVVKPAIFGAMREAAALLLPLRPRLVFSSVFETSIGFESVLRWASRWQADGCAAGFGTDAYLEEDGWFVHPRGPKVIRGLVDLARIWGGEGEG